MFAKGDRVVVLKETHGWGGVRPGDIGVVKKIDRDYTPPDVIVNFSSWPGWVGKAECFVLEGNLDEEVYY